MNDEIGIWRDITGADNNPCQKMITLHLICGHTVKIRTDTPIGQSFAQTEWKAAECHQCQGTQGAPFN